MVNVIETGSIIKLARSIWEAIASIRERGESRKIEVTVQKILRYFEEAQGKAIGTISYTIGELKIHGIISEEEAHSSLAGKALFNLCQAGKIEYSDGRYYLKGRVPPMPFNPYGA